MHCSDEWRPIEQELRRVSGVESLTPDFIRRVVTVAYDPLHTSPEQLSRSVRRAGFTVAGSPSGAPRFPRRALLGGGLLLAAWGVWYFLGAPGAVPAALLGAASVGVSGYGVLRGAWRSLLAGRLDMNTLMSIAAVGAIGLGEWGEGATAMWLFAVALWIEDATRARAGRALESLTAFSQATARKLDPRDANASPTPVDVHTLTAGDLVLVPAGERVPIDGRVLAGNSLVDESPLTGEALPVEKAAGDDVLAGSLCGTGSLRIEVLRPADESMFSHVVRLVRQAQQTRAPLERFIDRFAAWYTPAVLLLAALLALAPLGYFGLLRGDWGAVFEGVHRALVLLVIACPCALVLSTPITMACGLHRAARQGIVVKGSEFLEAAFHLRGIAFDKTGTLTAGRPRLVEVIPAEGEPAERLLSLAGALEAESTHPLARAIREAAAGERHGQAVEDLENLPGMGIAGRIGGARYFLAAPGYFRREGNSASLADLTAWESEAPGTLAILAREDRLLGALRFAELPRDDAAGALAELRALGMERFAMLSGDRRSAAEAIGNQLGIEEIHAELLPHEKVAALQELSERFAGGWALVGDGVNDAPALAAARVGIALGVEASDTALEAADVAILSDQLQRVPQFLRLARQTRARLWQNIGFALGVKGLVLLLAAAGFANMWMAVAADVGASLLVSFNGMRLLRARLER